MQHRVDIFSINETWLMPTKPFSAPGYNIFRADRQQQAGGGACLLIADGITSAPLTIPHTDTGECCAVILKEVLPNNEDLIVASYYCPPGKPIDKDLLAHLAGLHHNVLILGDLNAHHTGGGSAATPRGKRWWSS